ncbi:MAG: HAD hydrolase-like protein [Deltaproteobacteria bacterium]|nr:HAD hydrolase-like protein [Deltaproteobacteria bacterium]
MRKLILFDIDGTLLMTGGAGKEAFDRVFSEFYGIEQAWRDIHPDGRTDPSLIVELFEKNLGRRPSSEEMERVSEAYARAMEEALPRSERFRLLPGVVELLDYLADRKIGMLGLATGNFESTAAQKLRHGGLHHYFRFGGYGSDHGVRLELTRAAVERGRSLLGGHLPNEEIILVGDTVHDIDCGRRLDLTTVAVATGSTPRATLEAARPDFVLDSLSPLEEVALIFD